MKLLSVIVPCYNEQETVEDFYAEFLKIEDFFAEKDVEIEFLFIDDGSKDETAKIVKTLSKEILAKRQQFMPGWKRVKVTI